MGQGEGREEKCGKDKAKREERSWTGKNRGTGEEQSRAGALNNRAAQGFTLPPAPVLPAVYSGCHLDL